MECTIDAVVINSLLRPPKHAAVPPRSGTAVDPFIEGGMLHVYVDPDRSIIHEWAQTSGHEGVSALVVKWEDAGALRMVTKLGHCDSVTSKRMRQLSFLGTVDKLHVKVAAALKDKNIVSGDPDFWDPCDKGSVGNTNAPVYQLLRTRLGVTPVTLVDLLLGLEQLAASTTTVKGKTSTGAKGKKKS